MSSFLFRVQKIAEKEFGFLSPSTEHARGDLYPVVIRAKIDPSETCCNPSSQETTSRSFLDSRKTSPSTSNLQSGKRPVFGSNHEGSISPRISNFGNMPQPHGVDMVKSPLKSFKEAESKTMWAPKIPASQSLDLEDRPAQDPSLRAQTVFKSEKAVATVELSPGIRKEAPTQDADSSFAAGSRMSMETPRESFRSCSTHRVRTLSEVGLLTATFSPCRYSPKDEDGRLSRKYSDKSCPDSIHCMTITEDHFKTVRLDSMEIDVWYTGRRRSREFHSFLPMIKEELNESEDSVNMGPA